MNCQCCSWNCDDLLCQDCEDLIILAYTPEGLEGIHDQGGNNGKS